MSSPQSHHGQDQTFFTEKVGNELFRQLIAIFPLPARLRSDDPAQAKAMQREAKRQITLALIESGIRSDAELRRGLQRARQESWWPLPSQFVRWCQPTPAELGLPSLEDAYREASRLAHPSINSDVAGWSHPAVFVAARATGMHELATLPISRSREIFERAYEMAIRRLVDGENLSATIPPALPREPATRRADPVKARHHLNQIRSMLRRPSE